MNIYNNYLSTHANDSKRLTPSRLKILYASFNQHYKKFIVFDTPKKVLDIGCGSGALVSWLKLLNFSKVLGIDLSKDQINHGIEYGFDNLVYGDAQKFLKTSTENWDVIFLRDVLEHFDSESGINLLKACYSKLTKDGRIIIQVPNGMSPYFGSIYFSDITHKTAYTSISLRQICKIAGFARFQFYPWRIPIYSISSFIAHCVQRFINFLLSIPFFVEGQFRPILTKNIIFVATKS